MTIGEDEEIAERKIQHDLEEIDKLEGNITVEKKELKNLEKKEKKKEKEPKPIETSKIIKDGVMWEEIYDPTTKQAVFVTFDEKSNQLIPIAYQLVNGIKYIPINDDLLQKRLVILPTGISEYGDVNLLRTDIKNFIHKYVDISKEHEEKAGLYVELTWVFDNVRTMPYLRAMGDYGTGKTRYEDVIGGICYKPMYVGGSVRSAPIFRVIDRWRGTAIFDEFTLQKSDESEDIIQILNNGFQRGKAVLRCKDGNYSEVEAFDPFCPKIISTRKTFHDKALESRCITEILTETSRVEIPIDLGNEFEKERAELQNKLLLYRLKNWKKITPDENLHIDFGNIQPRIKQTFLPFIVLFQNDTAQLTSFIKTISNYNEMLIEENSSTREGIILKIYLTYISEEMVAITPTELRNELVNNHGFDSDKTTPINVGKVMKTLGFKSVTKKNEQHKTIRVFSIENKKLKKLILKYIPMDEQQKYLQSLEPEEIQSTLLINNENGRAGE